MKTITDMLKKGINQNHKAVDVSMKFQSLTQDEKRVLLAMTMCEKYKISLPGAEEQKSAEKSKKWRDKGNQIFVRNNSTKHFVEACELYSKSIAFAPNDSDELSLAYANRSAVLFRLGKYDECVQDIERCLRLNYPDHLKLKILLRKTECLVILKSAKVQKSYEEALEWIKKGSADVEKMKAKLDSCYHKTHCMESKQESANLNIIFKDFCYSTCNNEVPASSDALIVSYDEIFGRHVVATRDIRPGEIIANETPYCLVLSLSNKYSHCWGCLEYIWNGIPCDHCVHVMYCSEKCRDESWKKFHDVECIVLRHLMSMNNMSDLGNLNIMSLRLVILAVRELESISNLIAEVKDVEKCTGVEFSGFYLNPRIKGFSTDGKFYSNKYRSVYSLITNTEKRSAPDLFDRATYAAILVYYLATKTEFFGIQLPENWEELCTNDKVTFIGGLILRHQQIIPSNGHSHAEECNLETYELCLALMPFFSFINHSCDANVTRSCRKEYQLLFALYPIKKGEQIFDNYGIHYAVTPKIFRQESLSVQFLFNCSCIACQEDWPVYHQIKSYNDTIKCNKIKTMLDNAMCHFSIYIKSAMVGKIEDKPLILKNLSNMIEVLLKYVTLPCKEVNDVIEVIKRVFDLNGNRFILPNIVT